MNIKKHNGVWLIELMVRKDKFLVLASDKPFDGGWVRLLNTGVEVMPSTDSRSSMHLIRLNIESQLKASGLFFENPEPFYKKCLGCGRGITYDEATSPNKLCCGTSSVVLPEWKLAQESVLKNVHIFKMK